MSFPRTSGIRATLAGLALALAAAPAVAAPPSTNIVVQTHDLDLAQTQDARLALIRIEAAARQACLAPGFALRLSVRGCMRVVIGDTVRALKAPGVTAAWKEGPRASALLATR